MKLLLAVAVAVVLSPALSAQDGLRSASLPERPIATQPPGPGDLYRAGPFTYRPRADRRPLRHEPPLGHRPGTGYFSSSWYWPYTDFPEPVALTEPARNPEIGVLQLRVSPAAALVYIDGVFEGTAGDLAVSGARLRPGVHRVRLEASGYEPATFDARVESGAIVTRSRVLDRIAPPPAPREPTPSVAAKAMYVIPRCYAGDRPPDASTGCDLTRLRTIR